MNTLTIKLPAETLSVDQIGKTWLGILLQWYQRARQRRHLAALDAHQLADIGVSRGDALDEAGKPFWRA